MTNNPNTQNRMLLDVVNLVAWHGNFTTETRSVSVHADAVFKESIVGAEPESLITFKLSVEKAELVIRVPESEPAKIRWESIELFYAEMGECHSLAEGFAVQQASNKTLKESIWAIRNGQSEGLIGRAWNPQQTPLLKIRNGSPNPNHALPPIIRVDIRCKGDDLKVTDIKIKDKPGLKRAHGGAMKKHQLAAAEAYIKSQLIAENLSADGVGEEYSTLLIASIEAESLAED